jgi:predicted DCC family thiol-disulfide oxidoreductase YuxK
MKANADHAAYPLTLLFDRNCAFCRHEMAALRERDAGRGRLRFVDISAPGFDAAAWGATPEELDARLHAVDALGRTHRGVPALRLAYTAVGLGLLWAPTRWPGLRWLSDAGYAAFARHRYAISKWAAPLIAHVAAVRTQRRLQRCADGVCRAGPHEN